jgi:hypothetical protein
MVNMMREVKKFQVTLKLEGASPLREIVKKTFRCITEEEAKNLMLLQFKGTITKVKQVNMVV